MLIVRLILLEPLEVGLQVVMVLHLEPRSNWDHLSHNFHWESPHIPRTGPKNYFMGEKRLTCSITNVKENWITLKLKFSDTTLISLKFSIFSSYERLNWYYMKRGKKIIYR